MFIAEFIRMFEAPFQWSLYALWNIQKFIIKSMTQFTCKNTLDLFLKKYGTIWEMKSTWYEGNML